MMRIQRIGVVLGLLALLVPQHGFAIGPAGKHPWQKGVDAVGEDLEEFRSLLKSSRSRKAVEDLVRRGDIHLTERLNYRAAVRHYKAAQRQEPNNSAIYRRLALAYEAWGQMDEAEEAREYAEGGRVGSSVAVFLKSGKIVRGRVMNASKDEISIEGEDAFQAIKKSDILKTELSGGARPGFESANKRSAVRAGDGTGWKITALVLGVGTLASGLGAASLWNTANEEQRRVDAHAQEVYNDAYDDGWIERGDDPSYDAQIDRIISNYRSNAQATVDAAKTAATTATVVAVACGAATIVSLVKAKRAARRYREALEDSREEGGLNMDYDGNKVLLTWSRAF